ncbi:MAG: flagellar biosynthesis protein FlhB [Gammaproteobacteria bacterium]
MPEGQNDSQEKTEQATPKKLDEAREKGQVTRSRELNSMAVLMGGAAILLLSGQSLINGLQVVMHDCFVISRNDVFDVSALSRSLANAGQDVLSTFTPFLLLITLIALLAPMLVGGWAFSPQAMSFKWDKLDPIKGLKRVFGVKGLMELAKALAKFVLILGLAVILLWWKLDDLLGVGRSSLMPALGEGANHILISFLIISAATILIAAVDVPFQIWEHNRQLKMTKQEIKDELKETEGRPEVKSKLRALQQELAFQRMMEEVPKADVIVTNPAHYAVALRYDQATMRAPRVVAKGVDLVAERIKQLGKQHKIIVFPAPMLARSLYYNTRIDQEIPTGLYIAVAQIMAYVFQLLESHRIQDAPIPSPPKDLPIPDELKRDS